MPCRCLTVLFLCLTALVCVPAGAHADAGMQVATDTTSVAAQRAVNYRYSFTYATAGARYTVAVENTASGSVVYGPEVHALNGQPGSVTGEGQFTPSVAGRYRVVINYYRVGQTNYEAHGEALFLATDPMPSPPQDPAVTAATTGPSVTPVTPPTTEKKIITDPPSATHDPVITDPVVAHPQGEARRVSSPARLRLSQRALTTAATVGGRVKVRLAVMNIAASAATQVRVCVRVPSALRFHRASRVIEFTGATGCVAVGALAPGQTVTFTVQFVLARAARGNVTNRASASAANAATVTAGTHVLARK